MHIDWNIVWGVVLTVGVFGGLFGIGLLNKKFGDKIDNVLHTIDSGLSTATTLVSTIDPHPDDELHRVMGWISNGVGAAEQLYKVSKLSATERKPYAMKFAKMMCEYAGIPWSSLTETYAETILEDIVGALPETHPAATPITHEDLTQIAVSNPGALIRALQTVTSQQTGNVASAQANPQTPAPAPAAQSTDATASAQAADTAEP